MELHCFGKDCPNECMCRLCELDSCGSCNGPCSRYGSPCINMKITQKDNYAFKEPITFNATFIGFIDKKTSISRYALNNPYFTMKPSEIVLQFDKWTDRIIQIPTWLIQSDGVYQKKIKVGQNLRVTGCFYHDLDYYEQNRKHWKQPRFKVQKIEIL